MIKKRINKKRENDRTGSSAQIKIQKNFHKEIIVWTQIFILAIGIIAIAYSLGSEIKFVSGDIPTKSKTSTTDIPAGDANIRYLEFNKQFQQQQKALRKNYYNSRTVADMQTQHNFKGDPYNYFNDGEKWYYNKGTANPGDSVKPLDDKGVKVVESRIGATDKQLLDAAKAEAERLKQQKLSQSTFPEGAGILGNHLWKGLQWSAVIVTALQLLRIAGLSGEISNSLSIAAVGGIMSGQLVAGLTTQGGLFGTQGAWNFWGGTTPSWVSTWGAAGIGIAVGVMLFYKFYKQVDKKIVTFTCLSWQAATGGDKCEECNKQGDIPCSEYQCKSLGQSCELVNQGTDNEKCVYINENDVKYPTIEPWDGALINEEDYEYTPDSTISPPDRGVNINYSPSTSKCVKAFTPLSFGVTLNEPASCKIDTERKQDFEDMSFFMSGGLSLYNHSYTLSLPGTAALESEGITIQNNGEYELFVRCRDANGNSNTADFVFKFCVEEIDTTPPLIVTTSIPSENPIAYEQTEVDIDVYVNEPSQCKWSHTDQSYENMENAMVCSTSVFEMNAQMLYNCTTTLTGLKNREENKFYFRCKDKEGNTNTESQPKEGFVLMGTQPLVIDWVKPEDGTTIKDATESIKVTLEAQTSAGYNEGRSSCEYSETGETGDYILFFGDENIDNYRHSQDLWLGEGDYTYYIKCYDLGGNPDVETTTFTVESDASPPIVVRALHEETYLRLITNEPATCVYDTTYTDYPCDYSFENGLEMTVVDDVNHYTEWNSDITLYIKCEDSFGTQSAPDECSMIVRPSDNY